MSIKKYVFGQSENLKLFLDEQPYTSLYAYSLRKLRSSYISNCVRVRRSSDNLELDIGFINNSIDTSALLNFVGSNDGFVSVWYDQGGGNKNSVQTVLSSQPKIVSSGVILLENNLPTISFSVKDYMLINDNRSIDESCIFYVNSVKEGSQRYYGVSRHIPSVGYGFGLFTANGIQNPSIVPYKDSKDYTPCYHLFVSPDPLPTQLILRGFSRVGSTNISDTIASRNNYADLALPNESNWGNYNDTAINAGYFDARANMSLSEYIVIPNSNRENFNKLIINSLNYYKIKY